jgi:antitoxin component HigA of HigAB toxin-antitoxin module
MTPPSSDRTGILILRLWIEADAREGLRARITQTLDSGDEQAMTTAAEPEDIYAVVRTWVEAFVDAETHPVTLA